MLEDVGLMRWCIAVAKFSWLEGPLGREGNTTNAIGNAMATNSHVGKRVPTPSREDNLYHERQ